jgi:apolipoprotein D and lipocalin family protein
MNFRGLCSLAVLCLLSACDRAAPLALADHVDLERMYGGWYLIATIPNGFEKGMVQPYDVYSKRPDGDIREDFYLRRGSFSAPQKHFTVHDWVRPGTHNAHWRVQFGPINVPFLVLYVDPDYKYVLFGEQSRHLAWIYAREPDISEAQFDFLMMRFRDLGFDPSSFKRFVQHPDQIGRAGFWSDGVMP